MREQILVAAQDALRNRLRNNAGVSENTRDAQRLARFWRTAVHGLDPSRYQIEVSVAPEFDQRIDVVDVVANTAYEFKVSGNNAATELYKDVVKVILCNRKRQPRITRLVFITEYESGRKSLDSSFVRAYVEHLSKDGLDVVIDYVRNE